MRSRFYSNGNAAVDQGQAQGSPALQLLRGGAVEQLNGRGAHAARQFSAGYIAAPRANDYRDDGKVKLAAPVFGAGGQQILPTGAVLDLGREGVRLGDENFSRSDVLPLGVDRQGRVVMLGGYTTPDVHDPTELPTFLAGFRNKKFRHAEMCQVVPVKMDQDKYRVFSSTAAFQPAHVKTTDYSTPEEITFPSSLTQYNALVRRIAAFIPDPVRDQAKTLWDVVLTNMKHCRRMIDIDLELDVMGPTGLLTTSTNWATGYYNTNLAGYQWGGASGPGANSDPIRDLQSMITTSADDITAFWLNRKTALDMLRHGLVRDHLRSMKGDSQLDNDITRIADGDEDVNFALPGIGKFKVATSRISTGTLTTGYIFPDGVVVGVVQPGGVPTNGEEVASAYTFRVETENGTGFNVRQVRVDVRGAGGTLIIVEEKSAQVMVGNIVGGWLGGLSQ